MLSNTKHSIQIVCVSCFFVFAIGPAVFSVLVPDVDARIGRAVRHHAVAIVTRLNMDLPTFLVLLTESLDELRIIGAIDP